MDLQEVTLYIKNWAKERGLDNADPGKQMLKLGEEYGELCEGMAKNRGDMIVDSVGDMYVVMTILCMQLNINIETCINVAYHEIKDRKGEMKDGVFVKESDLNG